MENKTPYDLNIEEFTQYYEKLFLKQYGAETVALIRDAYSVGISEMWTEKEMLNSNDTRIYKEIIINANTSLCNYQAFTDDKYKEQLIHVKIKYQKKLLETLTKDILTFCLDKEVTVK